MPALQPVRGTQDLLPDDQRRHRIVTDTARQIAERYGYAEIATPIFEFTEVFSRPIGEATDIVQKEMYTFLDRGGEEITLRPEYTAGIVRAIISNGLTQSLPLKLFASGPMFRYERPQKGRMRQFHQIGIELLGVAQPTGDVEVIACGAAILRDLALLDRTVLELNTLGDGESRIAYRQALIAYFSSHREKLSADSRERLERNPMRILDSKDAADRALIADAPAFGDYLNQASRDFFAAVTGGLDELSIAYRLNPRLVRGLDYYCHTAFEFTTSDLGAQGTVMGGGRYDGLVAVMGGPATPGAGWAAGIDRIAMMLAQTPPARRPIAVIPIGDAAELQAANLAEQLRRAGFAIELGYGGNIAKRMKRADKLAAAAAVILGEDELAKGVASLRDLDSGEQAAVPLAELEERLARFR